MKNIWILLLMTSAIFLNHCGKKENENVLNDDGSDPQAPAAALNLEGSECIGGVYSGESDMRWNYLNFRQKINLSIAFQGQSALVQAKGSDGDMLCTHYEGIKVSPQEEREGSVVIFKHLIADKVTRSRKEGSANFSNKLADTFTSIQVISGSADSSACIFRIGSVSPGGREEHNTINSNRLGKSAETADFNTILEECGTVSAFSPAN